MHFLNQAFPCQRHQALALFVLRDLLERQVGQHLIGSTDHKVCTL